MEAIKNKSPLRYPGGKTRACNPLTEILAKHFDMSSFEHIVSPFFGGGSFEFHVQHLYNLNIIANDKFQPLYNFWNVCISNKKELCDKLYKHIGKIDKETFGVLRNTIMDESDHLQQAVMYFIINRCSFSGATLSGGFSSAAASKRFTTSSVDRVGQLNLSKFNIFNLDFEDFIQQNHGGLLFLDPPYYLEKKSKLYGNNGDMHEHFDHVKLHKCVSTRKNWLMTYNNCEFIRNLYKDFNIIQISWSYGMNKSKESSEIVIIG